MFEGKILAICLASLHVNSIKTRQSGKWGEHANVTATATVAFIVACDTFHCSLIKDLDQVSKTEADIIFLRLWSW